jgi:uncharacterized membrane protein
VSAALKIDLIRVEFGRLSSGAQQEEKNEEGSRQVKEVKKLNGCALDRDAAAVTTLQATRMTIVAGAIYFVTWVFELLPVRRE